MDPSSILPYLWVLVVLVFLEGLLAADNDVVIAVMVNDFVPDHMITSLFYVLLGAFIFRFISLFLISIIAHFWWIQALGALYLLYMSIKNLISFFKEKEHHVDDGTDDHHFDESGEE